jgi:replication-associated recombination protein RarA
MDILTRKDYNFYEVSSAFQKAIRRGHEKEALFFGFELYSSGYSKYAWKRIMVITTEDIGLANPDLPQRIIALYQMWQVIAEKNLAEGSMPFIQAVITLVRSEKSRAIDEYKIYLAKTGEQLDIPDYALDVHTRRGKIKGRGHKFFLEHGRKIENEKEVDIPTHVSEFYEAYLNEYAEKKVPITGYDERNVIHNSIKEMNKWKAENAQKKLFND